VFGPVAIVFSDHSLEANQEDADVSSRETDRGKAIFEELLWVHSIIRRDLEIVERLAADVGDGLPGEAVEDALGELKTAGPLWQLKMNCLRYCSHVHAHHGAEDVLLFPALRAVDPSIGPVVDRLEADHARVSDLLDVVEAAARALTDTDGGDASSTGCRASMSTYWDTFTTRSAVPARRCAVSITFEGA
jgi:hypothetical protein